MEKMLPINETTMDMLSTILPFSEYLSSPKAKKILSTGASVVAYGMLVRSITRDYLSFDLYDHAVSKVRTFFFSHPDEETCCIIINQYEGDRKNKLFEAVEHHLNSKQVDTSQKLKVSIQDKEEEYTKNAALDNEITDVFEGVQYKWKFVFHGNNDSNKTAFVSSSSSRYDFRTFYLTFNPKYRDVALNAYLPYLLKGLKEIEVKKRLRLHTLTGSYYDMWSAIDLDHQATFEKLAMDDEPKKKIMNDIQQFTERKEYYRKVGKAWKRGYLLYGPPGTGKSSLVAAMAHFLDFDIYDLELNSVRDNAELRRILLGLPNKSILVLEDIDCAAALCNRDGGENRKPHNDCKLTLSGVLNVLDGLWSSAGDERIIIFTTNYKERLDPALLRPGRMDMHIPMSYCTFCGFKILVSNYLEIDNHPLFDTVESLIGKVEITPAEVVELLIRSKEHTDAIQNVIEAMEKKMKQDKEVKDISSHEKEEFKQEMNHLPTRFLPRRVKNLKMKHLPTRSLPMRK